MPKVPFWATVARTYRVVFGHFGALVCLGAVAMVAFVALIVLGGDGSPHPSPIDLGNGISVRPVRPRSLPGPPILATLLASVVVAAAASAAFTIAWVRSVLLEEPQRLHLGRKEMRALGSAALIGVILVILALMIGWASTQVVVGPFIMMNARSGTSGSTLTEVFIVTMVMTYLLWFVIAAVGSRLALSFPGIAVGRPQVMGAAWDLSQGNTLRLMFGGMFVSGPLTMFGWAARETIAPLWPIGVVGRVAAATLDVVTGFTAFGLEITFITLSYAYLSNRRPQALIYEGPVGDGAGV